ncbi:MAG: magnesium transporter [Candidatus Azotimanducaceae bacterium]|jgi:magnesium transporter
MITHYYRTLKDDELKEVDSVRAGVWTHVVSPTDDELAQLEKEFALDDGILEDARDFFEVPRMERSQGATYFFTRYPYDQKDEDIDTAPLLIVTGESFVLTIAQREVPQLNAFISGKEVVHTTQKSKLFIQIMSAVTDSFEQELVHLRRAVHKDKVRINKIGNKEITRLVNYEHQLNDMISAMVPTNRWLQQVTGGNYMQFYNEDVELMEDLMIANSQMVDSARSILNTIQNIRSATEAILTNNLNATIQTLTVLTIILTIPTIVASLYGMNVHLPLMDHAYAFWLVLLIILIIVSSVVWFFKRSKWL